MKRFWLADWRSSICFESLRCGFSVGRVIVTTSSKKKNDAAIAAGNFTAEQLGIDTSEKWVVEAVCRKDNDGKWSERVKELTEGHVRSCFTALGQVPAFPLVTSACFSFE